MTKKITNSAREKSLARRRAMSRSGKTAIATDRTAQPANVNSNTGEAVSASSALPTSSPLQVNTTSARKASLERRIAMSRAGKNAYGSADRTRSGEVVKAKSATNNAQTKTDDCKQDESCGCGCKENNKSLTAESAQMPVDHSLSMNVSADLQQNIMRKIVMSSARAATLSRRRAMSAKGKAALKGGTVSEASAARAANPNITSRELAQVMRAQRSEKGKTGKKQTTKPTGPMRRKPANETGPAEDASWKVGASDTTAGQTVTGTMVDRKKTMTGNEASTCRSVTGTEYMGADVFKDFCQESPKESFNRVSVTSTATGNTVTGNEVGRSERVTGDEPGTCKNVTGTEYLSAEQSTSFCGKPAEKRPVRMSMTETVKGKKVTGNNVGRSSKMTGDEVGSNRLLTGTQYMKSLDEREAVPAKVSESNTLRGGKVSGGAMSRSQSVTGNEIGGCKYVTGDDYVSQEEYTEFCEAAPAPKDQKTGVSNTLAGKTVTGTMTGRGSVVTGDEPGTCQSVTGTPYAGREQYKQFCTDEKTQIAAARNAKALSGSIGMTGIQPGVAGKVSGDAKGACESVSGTPYIGVDQVTEICDVKAASPTSPDFPQMMEPAPWQAFSVTEPSNVPQAMEHKNAVTGMHAGSGRITGPFGMATGKITGTDDARFDKAKGNAGMQQMQVAQNAQAAGNMESRVTGEGVDAGKKITGDDWDRGDRVTGTEGMSATRRNPTRRGGMTTMTQVEMKRNEQVELPVSKVTGSSGNTEKGSLITYSGGARG